MEAIVSHFTENVCFLHTLLQCRVVLCVGSSVGIAIGQLGVNQHFPIFMYRAVADLEGAEPAPPPPPFGDGLTPSLTVMLANAKF